MLPMFFSTGMRWTVTPGGGTKPVAPPWLCEGGRSIQNSISLGATANSCCNAPRAHKAEPEELTDAEHLAIARATTQAVALLRRAVSAQGFNLGINLGRVAGAGVPGHLHQHIHLENNLLFPRAIEMEG